MVAGSRVRSATYRESTIYELSMFGTLASRLSTTAFAALAVAVGFMLQDPLSAEFRVNVVFLLVVFAIPALGLTRPRDVVDSFLPLLALALTGTFAWDAATAFFAASRPFLSEWYIVYVSGPGGLMALFLLHAFISDRLAHTIEPVRGPRR
jgi:hypothetical protein